MANVTLRQEGDAVAVRWGEDGKERLALTDSELRKAFRLSVAEGLSRGEVRGMTDMEREIALDISERAGVRKAHGDGLVVAWFPYDGTGGDNDAFARTLSELGGGRVPVEDIHLTVAYLGEVDDYDVDLVAAVTKLISLWWYGADGKVAGTGRFVIGPDEDALVALVDSSELGYLRERIIEEICCYSHVDYDALYGHGYVPHLTVGYAPRSAASLPGLDEPLEFRVDSLTVAAGAMRKRFEFGSGPSEGTRDEMEPYFAARHAVTVAKAGRVLSGRNLRSLQDAYEAMGAVIASEVARRRGEETGEDADLEKAVAVPELEYTSIMKADDEQRYTFGPLYAPDRKDAHGEWTDLDNLQHAVWSYVQDCVDKGSNRLKLQHGQFGEHVTCGRWLDVVSWPYETTIKIAVPGEDERELVMPAGTVYMGVQWDETVWDEVKKGKLTGLSLGGKALRVAEGSLSELDHMGDKLAGKMGRHDYVGKGKRCEKCNKAFDDGDHNPISKGAEGVAPVLGGGGTSRILGLTAELIKAEEERAAEDRSMLHAALEAIKGVAGRQVGDVHVHVPEQNVHVDLHADVKPADVHLDVVE